MTEHEWMTTNSPFAMIWFLANHNTIIKRDKYKFRNYVLLCCVMSGHDHDIIEKYVEAVDWVNLAQAWAGDQKKPDEVSRATMLRCIFENPFKESIKDKKWITPDVLSLARSVLECDICDGAKSVEEHRAGEMRGCVCPECADSGQLVTGTLNAVKLSILCDALEEAGCYGPMIEHLRSPIPHYPSCWVVQFIKEKQ